MNNADEGNPCGRPGSLEGIVKKTFDHGFDLGRADMYRQLRGNIEQLLRENPNPSKAEILAIFDAETRKTLWG